MPEGEDELAPDQDSDSITPWQEAALAAALMAVDPSGLGGIELRALPGPVRDAWLTLFRGLIPASAPMRKLPLNAHEDRLFGGLDLTATLQTGRPVAEAGLLAEINDGVLVIAMAERIAPATAARIVAVQEAGSILSNRGASIPAPARFGMIALDEGLDTDEAPPPVLLERLALHIDLTGVTSADAAETWHTAGDVADARLLYPQVEADDEVVHALCATACALGIQSIRPALLALKVARACTALDGRTRVATDDAALAARLVLSPRATVIPMPAPPEPEQADEQTDGEQQSSETSPGDAEGSSRQDEMPPADVVLAAAEAAIPPDILALLRASAGRPMASKSAGRAGVKSATKLRGRPIGVRRGDPRSGQRLALIDTLRAAAPWQTIRRRTADTPSTDHRIHIERDDFRVVRSEQRTATTTIFAVDASGSSALHRLAEAKGAIELLLAECYVRRDQVALIAFRGRTAELILPPTRSLTRAKRSLAALPGGGGTPLGAGLDAAARLADGIRRKGQTPVVVVLTDGRANVSRSGETGRQPASADALAAARFFRLQGLNAVLVDTSPKPQEQAAAIAAAMGARYLPLPHADAATLSVAIRSTAGQRSRSSERPHG